MNVSSFKTSAKGRSHKGSSLRPSFRIIEGNSQIQQIFFGSSISTFYNLWHIITDRRAVCLRIGSRVLQANDRSQATAIKREEKVVCDSTFPLSSTSNFWFKLRPMNVKMRHQHYLCLETWYSFWDRATFRDECPASPLPSLISR